MDVQNTKSSVLVVSERQRSNPVVAQLKNIPFEIRPIVPDFIGGRNAALVYLSLKYHRLHPNYIEKKLDEVSNDQEFKHRILLCLVDIPNEFGSSLLEVTLLSFKKDFTLQLCWSIEEAARVIELWKSLESKSQVLIMGKVSTDLSKQQIASVASCPAVNKTDGAQLLQYFGSLASFLACDTSEIKQCPGIGDKKIKQLSRMLEENFF